LLCGEDLKNLPIAYPNFCYSFIASVYFNNIDKNKRWRVGQTEKAVETALWLLVAIRFLLAR
jgi:hypothetical protein